MIAADDFDAEDMLFVVKKLQSFGTGGCRKTRLNIDFSETPNLYTSMHNASTYEGLVPLRLIESSHQRPNLQL